MCIGRLSTYSYTAVLTGLLLSSSFSTLAQKPLLDFDTRCTSIASQLDIQNTTVFFSQLVPAGTTLTFPDNSPTCARPSQLVQQDICRIAMFVATSHRSGINMEAWLPRNWTGRFLSTGNGALSGCIQYEDMAYTSALGFATVGANNGHNGTSGAAFLNNPDVLADFIFRSIHTNVVVGKEITQKFFGQPHTKSYYLGCSTGGRQGFKSVQDFPEDFDGVVAGSPAFALVNLLNWSGHFLAITGTANDSSFVPLDQWTGLIHQSILEQCDGIDGVNDGIIEDPNLCDFKPEVLICPPGSNNSESCLTGDQAETVRLVYSPFYNLNGELEYPRQQPGSEVNNGSAATFYNGTQFSLTTDWFRFVVFSDPTLDTSKLNQTDFAIADAQNPFNAQSFNGDLSAFKSRGGKVLTYHGQADGLISPANSERYYTHVASTMSLPPGELDDFYRFFRISGMAHCSGGAGAWEIGQTLAGAGGELEGSTLDPDRNVLMALVRWVEEGVAPDTILGVKFVNDTLDLGVQFSRRHCRFPLRNMFNRIGDPTLPESWFCA